MLWLYPIDGVGPDAEARGRLTVGRAPSCDLALDVAAISVVHAIFESRRDGWYLKDLGSRNGTTINGAPVLARQGVKLGDEICFGGAARYTVREATPDGEAETALASTRSADHVMDEVAIAIRPMSEGGAVVVARPMRRTESVWAAKAFDLLHLLIRARIGGEDQGWVDDRILRDDLWGPTARSLSDEAFYKQVRELRNRLDEAGLSRRAIAKSGGRTRIVLEPRRLRIDEA